MKERLRAELSKPRKNASPLNLAAFLMALIWLALIPSASQVLGENPTFFQAHGTSPLFVGAILIALLVLGVLVLWLVLATAKRISSPHVYDWMASAATLLISLAVVSVIAARLLGGQDPSTSVWWAALLVVGFPLSVVFTLIIRRVSIGTVLVTVAGVVGIFPLLLLQLQGADSDSGVNISVSGDPASPPILLVIADELSYGVVQDDQGNVRPQYPNLKSLQMQSTTYTRAYVTANATHLSVPSMLIGLSDAREMPYLPGSLQTSGGPFTWLKPRYETAIISPVISEQDQAAGIAMLPTPEKSGSNLTSTAALQVLLADLTAVVGQVSLPAPLNSQLPEIDDRWFDFWNLVGFETSITEVPQLIEVLTAPGQPGIALWHTMLTHTPYQRDFDGNWWEDVNMGLTSLGLASPSLEPLHRQMYAAATREFDRQLGALFDALKQAGVYNEMLIIVTSDHGRTFGTASPWRVGDTRDQRWGEVAHVPLFVKEPGQTTPNFISAPRTLAQVSATILEQTGTTVTMPFIAAPPLGQDPKQAPMFWFDKRTGEAGFEELEPYVWPDAWLPEYLDPTTIDSPFADARIKSLIGQPMPVGYSVVGDQTIQPDPGPAVVQPLTVEVAGNACNSFDEPALVLSGGLVQSSVVWAKSEDGATAQGWSLVPVGESNAFEIACRN